MNCAFCRAFIFTGSERKCHEDAWIPLMKQSVKVSFIIQNENRIHPAASDYTFTDYTPVVVFSQMKVQRSNKHNKGAKTSLSLVMWFHVKWKHQSFFAWCMSWIHILILMKQRISLILTHPGIPLMISVVWRHLINWWSEREESTQKTELLQGTGTHIGNDPDEGHCWERDRVDRRSEMEQKTGDKWMRGKGHGEE